MSNFEAVKQKLLDRKEELENLLSQIYKDEAQDQTQDVADQASSSSLEALKISLHNNEQAEYKMVLKALEMINEGTYGVCIECGKPISEKRLAIFPTSTRCIVCQEALEEKRTF